jgi:hypothetical protein
MEGDHPSLGKECLSWRHDFPVDPSLASAGGGITVRPRRSTNALMRQPIKGSHHQSGNASKHERIVPTGNISFRNAFRYDSKSSSSSAFRLSRDTALSKRDVGLSSRLRINPALPSKAFGCGRKPSYDCSRCTPSRAESQFGFGPLVTARRGRRVRSGEERRRKLAVDRPRSAIGSESIAPYVPRVRIGWSN